MVHLDENIWSSSEMRKVGHGPCFPPIPALEDNHAICLRRAWFFRLGISVFKALSELSVLPLSHTPLQRWP